MDYLKFQKKIRKEVAKKLGSHYDIKIKSVAKNNNVSLTGLSFSMKKSMLKPVIYLEDYFDRYLEGEPISGLADDVICVYRSTEVRSDSFEKIDLSFEKWKKKIVYRLVSKKKNKEALKDIPHVPYLDLVVIFYLVYDSRNDVLESIRIENNLAEKWNLTAAELFRIAEENTPRLFPYKLEYLHKLLDEDETNDVLYTPERDPDDSFFVLSNTNVVYGASVILYPKLLKRIAEDFNSDLYVLPSSIHEVLILPLKKIGDKEAFSKIISEVNSTCLSEEEILSNHTYIYRMKKERLEM